jgi:hypothetical protein
MQQVKEKNAMNTPSQGFFESDNDYRERIAREADERTIESNTGDEPKQGFFESDDDYRERISEEADESVIEAVTDDAPKQGFFENDDHYRDRISLEADESTIEDSTGDAPSQGFFESDDHYRDRVSVEADESIIEKATGDAPSQGFFESDDSYRERVAEEADEHRASSDDSGGGCFLTTACTVSAGLPDDCKELTVLRQFRDGFIANLPDGLALIEKYYAIAPGIVARINAAPTKAGILADILADVRNAVGLIEAGQNNAALNLYRSMTERVSAIVDAPN